MSGPFLGQSAHVQAAELLCLHVLSHEQGGSTTLPDRDAADSRVVVRATLWLEGACCIFLAPQQGRIGLYRLRAFCYLHGGQS